jgi:hypothetical protein
MEGRALNSDILCRNSEEPECGGGCYPTTAPCTPSTRGWYFSQKTITVRAYGMRFCNQGTEFCGRYERCGTDFQSNWEIIKVLLFS